MKAFFPLFLMIFLFACQPKQVDLIVTATTIYTVNDNFDTVQALAIKDGKIEAVGSKEEILKKYQSQNIYDADNNVIFPGFIDAHAHFYGLGKTKQIANLKGATSWEETLNSLQVFAQTHPEGWLLGRGWDQNDWANKTFPTKEQLDKLYPDRPVYLTRIDGHAAIVNQKALDLAEFSINTKISGGQLIAHNGKLSGVLIDMAKDSMSSFIPPLNQKQNQKVLKEAQKLCFANGLTSVVDAGLETDLVEIIEDMQVKGILKIRLYVMLSDSQEHIDYLVTRGTIKTPQLHVGGIKFYADGALGSRGAFLKKDYSDDPGNKGILIIDTLDFKKKLQTIYDYNFQAFTHAIGDNANKIILKAYADILQGKNDRRWRIEHAQVVAPSDFVWFKDYNIIPSVQPTHATSDMYWAGDRLGDERLATAYAYKQLLDQNGWLPLGTDFPIEQVSPLLTFYAAAVRKDAKGFPENGFQTANALTRKEALKGMTIWAAKGTFDEQNKGSLEKGKLADFIVLDQDIMNVSENKILQTKVLSTFVGGKQVFENNN